MFVQIFSSIGAVEVVEKSITKYDLDNQTVKKNVVIKNKICKNQLTYITHHAIDEIACRASISDCKLADSVIIFTVKTVIINTKQ